METALIGIALAGLVALFALNTGRNMGAGKVTDPMPSLENIRMGIRRGWYTAVLKRMYGKPFVVLSGKDTNGEQTTDIYPISEQTFKALKNDGVQVQY